MFLLKLSLCLAADSSTVWSDKAAELRGQGKFLSDRTHISSYSNWENLPAGYVRINFWKFLLLGELSCSRLRVKVANKGQEPLHSSVIPSRALMNQPIKFYSQAKTSARLNKEYLKGQSWVIWRGQSGHLRKTRRWWISEHRELAQSP